MRLRRLSLLAVPLFVFAAACAPADDPDAADSSDSAAPSDTPQTAAECATGKTMSDGILHIGTDSPAYDPWFSNDDPTNGEGFESAVAYEVAERLGFSADEVMWVVVPFNQSYKPGAKEFDFDINQISITPERAEVVDFSDGYYNAAQAVIMLKDSAAATSMADLQGLTLGAQTGTTSLTAIRDVIQPTADPLVFEDTNAAKQALLNGQVDAILADLPTAFYITAVEIPQGTIVGQFQADTGVQEQFGMLFEKGNPLRDCVNLALAEMTADGSLAEIEAQWLSDSVGVPELS